MTHGSDLKVKVIKHLSPNKDGHLNLVQLFNCSGQEAYDVGASVVVMAGGVNVKVSLSLLGDGV